MHSAEPERKSNFFTNLPNSHKFALGLTALTGALSLLVAYRQIKNAKLDKACRNKYQKHTKEKVFYGNDEHVVHCYGGMGSASSVFLAFADTINKSTGATVCTHTLAAYNLNSYPTLKRPFQSVIADQINQDLITSSATKKATFVGFCASCLPVFKAAIEAEHPPTEVILISPFILPTSRLNQMATRQAARIKENYPKSYEQLFRTNIRLLTGKRKPQKDKIPAILPKIPAKDFVELNSMPKQILDMLNSTDRRDLPFKLTVLLSDKDSFASNQKTIDFFRNFCGGAPDIKYISGAHDQSLRKETASIIVPELFASSLTDRAL